MSTSFSLLLSFLLFTGSPSFNQNKIQNIHSIESENYTQLITTYFSVENETSVSVGDVTLHPQSGSDSYISVTGTGTFGTNLQNLPIECSINGQTFYSGVPKWININAHKRVHVSWSGVIVVVDTEENM